MTSLHTPTSKFRKYEKAKEKRGVRKILSNAIKTLGNRATMSLFCILMKTLNKDEKHTLHAATDSRSKDNV